jgi:hypothetical protein
MQIFFHVENLSQKIDKNFDVSFSSSFRGLSRLRVFRSEWSSNTLQKRFCKNIVPKSFYQKNRQTSKTDFLSISFLSRFWAFLGEGSSKTPLKTRI